MADLICRALGYVLLIFLSFFLKKSGIFRAADREVLGKILMYVTLPFAFISFFRNFEARSSLVFFFFVGVCSNLVVISLGRWIAGRRGGKDRALYMIDSSGYNIGAFTSPFLGNVLSAEATVVASIFDIGNTIMSVGIVYPLARREVETQKGTWKEQVLFVLKKLFSSVPFDTYLVMLILSLLGFRLPTAVSNAAQTLGAPSIIINMIMIGIALEIQISREDIGDIIKILLLRYGMAILFAMLLTHLPFLQSIEKTALCYCILAPNTSISPTYCSLCGCRREVYGAVSTLSVLISICIFVVISI